MEKRISEATMSELVNSDCLSLSHRIGAYQTYQGFPFQGYIQWRGRGYADYIGYDWEQVREWIRQQLISLQFDDRD